MLTNSENGSLLVKVLDFGIAKILPATGDTMLKLTQTGEMLRSVLYMSPEQCLDKDLDGRSDCYSLGCVMYEALTGKPPLSTCTAFDTMIKHMSEMSERLDRDECLNFHWFMSLDDAREKIEDWRWEYNDHRSHTSLNFLTPTEFAYSANLRMQNTNESQESPI
jgi:serine/threonine protein kinase